GRGPDRPRRIRGVLRDGVHRDDEPRRAPVLTYRQLPSEVRGTPLSGWDFRRNHEVARISRRAGPEPPHRSTDEFPGEPTFYLAGIGDHDAKEVHMTNLLEGKTAIIYGGGGGIGSGLARAFAREGARVFLAGRTRGKLDAVAQDIASDGESAEVA